MRQNRHIRTVDKKRLRLFHADETADNNTDFLQRQIRRNYFHFTAAVV